ncbi:hypothetical protein ACFU98_10740 [Streptomyces sp. NPDC057575]|uniref:hypothetical protein n=1 Tax=unclassified Streptomyces TaxID=2593676 RepID=UPI0036B85067
MHNQPTICAEYSTHTADHPAGPCVLRPGHLGHIHQDMRGIQWANQTTAEECATGGIVNFGLNTGEISGCILPPHRPEDTERRARLNAAVQPTGHSARQATRAEAEEADTPCSTCKGRCYVPDWTRWDSRYDEPMPKPCPDCADTNSGSDRCCACGDSPVIYRNNLNQPLCCTCAFHRGPAVGSGSVEELQVRLRAAMESIHRFEQETTGLRRRVENAERRTEAQRSACQRALRDVAAVQRVRDLANRWYGQGAPATSYARELLATLDEVA